MTERKAAIIANKIYAAAYAKAISGAEASRALARLEPFMSEAQLCKLQDFLYDRQHNPFKFA